MAAKLERVAWASSKSWELTRAIVTHVLPASVGLISGSISAMTSSMNDVGSEMASKGPFTAKKKDKAGKVPRVAFSQQIISVLLQHIYCLDRKRENELPV